MSVTGVTASSHRRRRQALRALRHATEAIPGQRALRDLCTPRPYGIFSFTQFTTVLAVPTRASNERAAAHPLRLHDLLCDDFLAACAAAHALRYISRGIGDFLAACAAAHGDGGGPGARQPLLSRLCGGSLPIGRSSLLPLLLSRLCGGSQLLTVCL